MARALLGLLLPWMLAVSALGTLLRRAAPSNISSCDVKERTRLRDLLQKQQFDDIGESSCIERETVRSYKSGRQDWQDAREWLGDWEGPVENNTEFRSERCSKILPPAAVYLGWGHSGSTSLADLLNSHTLLSYGAMKEHNLNRRVRTDGVANRAHVDWRAYEQEFEVPCSCQMTIDFSAGGYLMNRYLPKLMYERYGPELKLIIMLRDPVDLLDSLRDDPHWLSQMQARNGTCYSRYLAHWTRVFPRKSFMFIRSEDFFQDMHKVVAHVHHFLRINHEFHTIQKSGSGRRRTSHVAITPNARSIWHHRKNHQKCKRRLEELTNMEFKWPGSS